MKIENDDLEQLKTEVKQSIIEQVGETEYYKMISDSLEKLVLIKLSIDAMFPDDDIQDKKQDFKKAVMDELVFEQYEDENDQLFYIGYYESVLDVFEF